jgi:hypothetical protein
VGTGVGTSVGVLVGTSVGVLVGTLVGVTVGVWVGVRVFVAVASCAELKVGTGGCEDMAHADKVIAINEKRKGFKYKPLATGLLVRLL